MPQLSESIAIFELRVPFEHGDSLEVVEGMIPLEYEAREALMLYLERKLKLSGATYGESTIHAVASLLKFYDARAAD